MTSSDSQKEGKGASGSGSGTNGADTMIPFGNEHSPAATSNATAVPTDTQATASSSSSSSSPSSSSPPSALNGPTTNGGGKKLFALFEGKKRRQEDIEAAAAASGASKRSSRPRNARITSSGTTSSPYIDVVKLDSDGSDVEFVAESGSGKGKGKGKERANGSSSSSKKGKSCLEAAPNGKKGSSRSTSPVVEKKPLPPLSLAVKGTGLKPDQTANPFFAKRAIKKAAEGEASPNGETMAFARSKRSLMQTPWPTTEDTHVQPIMESHVLAAEDATLPFDQRDRKGKGRERDRSHNWESHTLDLFPTGLLSRAQAAATESSNARMHRLMSRQQATCPGFSSFKDTATLHWVDQSAPLRADDVLGNVGAARYLRDWLHELQISTSAGRSVTVNGAHSTSSQESSQPPVAKKRRLIQKTVDKAARRAATRDRGGDGMDDFLVADDEEPTDADGAPSPGLHAEVEELANTFARPSQTADSESNSISSIPAPVFRTAGHLTNCLIISGPPGSGKTAAIYAAAHELNFEVFELFAGKDKRGGKELKETVGELARSHMVGGGGSGGGARGKGGSGEDGAAKASNAFGALLNGSRQQAHDESTGAGRQGDANIRAAAAARQSLILIEEADILYEEDQGFWRGVIDLIAKSKRPVVLTCNDRLFLQSEDLPVQEVLHFSRPSRDIAVPHLQTVAQKITGRDVAREEIERVLPDAADAGVDLRQAISQLQFQCRLVGSQPCGGRNGGDGDDLGTPPLPLPSSSDMQPISTQNTEDETLSQLKVLARSLAAISFGCWAFERPFSRQDQGEDPAPAPLMSSSGRIAPSGVGKGSGGSGDSQTASKREGEGSEDTTSAASGSELRVSSSVVEDMVLPKWIKVLRQQPLGNVGAEVLPLQGREGELAAEVERLADSLVNATCDRCVWAGSHSPELLESLVAEMERQQSFVYSMLCELDPFLLPPTPRHLFTLPWYDSLSSSSAPHAVHPAQKTDYATATLTAPYVRKMVAIEDEQETAHWRDILRMRKGVQNLQSRSSRSRGPGRGPDRSTTPEAEGEGQANVDLVANADADAETDVDVAMSLLLPLSGSTLSRTPTATTTTTDSLVSPAALLGSSSSSRRSTRPSTLLASCSRPFERILPLGDVVVVPVSESGNGQTHGQGQGQGDIRLTTNDALRAARISGRGFSVQ